MRIRPKTLALALLSSAVLLAAPRTASSDDVVALSPTAGGDTCQAATPITTLPFNDTGDTTGATDDIRLTGCPGFLSMAGPDHVYSFQVAAGNSLTFTLTPTDPTYDPAIYIRTACAQGSGSCVARKDDGKAGQAETMTVSGLAPGTYYFFVDSIFTAEKTGAEGHYTLSVTNAPKNTTFYTIAPCRVFDTRDPNGPAGGPALAAGSTRVFTIAGSCSVPTTARSVSINATVTAPTSPGYLTIFPFGTPAPLASTINFRTGITRANNAIVSLGGGGGLVSVVDGQSSGTVHLILDVNGYFQ